MLKMEVLINKKSMIEKVIDRTAAIIAKETIDAFSDIVKQTPVDKGTAKGNWLVNIGYPNLAENDTVDPGGGRTVAAGSVKITKEAIKKGVWITNNLPYIGRLEWGHSRQQPNGWIRKNIIKLKRRIREALK